MDTFPLTPVSPSYRVRPQSFKAGLTALCENAYRLCRAAMLLVAMCFLLTGTAQAQSFVATGSMATQRYAHTATLLNNGKVLIAGGATNSLFGIATDKAELYDPTTGKFSATGNMTEARSGHTATLLLDGRVLIVGGDATAEVYDPGSGKFTATGGMTSPRSGQSATLLPNGKVLIAGGTGPPSAELYNPAANNFTATSPMLATHSGHSGFLLPTGKVLIVGDGLTTELYNPATGAFSASGSSTDFHDSATLLANGKVLVAGGGGGFAPPSPSAELYNPTSGTFNTTGSLNLGRYDHATTLLKSGKVLFTGGVGVSSGGVPLTSTAELYDPSTGMFTSTVAMTKSRRSHTATLLPDGRVLVAGGNNGSADNTAELYTPAAIPTYNVSGRVALGNGSGLAGVIVSNGTLSATTASDGTYTITGLPGGVVSLTATKAGYTFTPEALTLNLSSTQTGADFTAVPLPPNVAPTLNFIPDPLAIPEDAGAQTVALSGISAGSGEIQVLSVSATSSNTALIPTPNVSYTSPLATASLTYTPLANQFGTAVITVTVEDNGGTANGGVDTVSRSFTVTVNPVNDAPVLSSLEGTSLIYGQNGGPVAVTSTLQVTDIDSPTLVGATVSITSGFLADQDVLALTSQNGISGSYSNGILTLSGTATLAQYQAALRSVAYSNISQAPTFGPRTLTFVVSDGASNSNLVSRVIAVSAVNNAPVAQSQSLSTPEDTPLNVTLSATDAESGNLTYSIVAMPSHGTLSGNAPNLVYTPGANYNGSDSFTFKANDGQFDSNLATVTLNVTLVNVAPTAQSQNLSGTVGQSLNFTLGASDPDGDALSYEIVSFSGDGTLGGGRVSGTAPTLSFITSKSGTYNLQFRVKDINGAVSNTATVKFVIGATSGQTVSGQVTSSEPNASYSASVIVPLPNAQVQLEQNGRILASAATDSAGRYTFYGLTLSKGTYTVHVTAIDTQSNGNPTGLPFVLTQSLKVSVPKKGSAPTQFSVPAFTLYSVWGQVGVKSSSKSPTLTPAPGASVRLSKNSSVGYPGFSSMVTADANGFYRFKFLGRASFSLTATASGASFKSATAKVPGTRIPVAPSTRLDLVGTPPTGPKKATTSVHNS